MLESDGDRLLGVIVRDGRRMMYTGLDRMKSYPEKRADRYYAMLDSWCWLAYPWQ